MKNDVSLRNLTIFYDWVLYFVSVISGAVHRLEGDFCYLKTKTRVLLPGQNTSKDTVNEN